jgi:hypothetical protein
VLAAVLALASRSARAAPPEPGDAEVRRRLAFLEDRLDRGAPSAARWWYGWFGGWLSLSVTEAVVAASVTNPDLRKDAAVSAFGASLGVLPAALFAFPARYAAADLRALPETTPAERRRKLAHAERLLRASAEAERLGRSWLTHTLSAGVSVAVGLVLGLGYKRPVTGVIDGVGGIALSEIKIFTQPTAAIGDLRDYEQLAAGSAPAAAPAARPAPISWTLAPIGGGVGVAARF